MNLSRTIVAVAMIALAILLASPAKSVAENPQTPQPQMVILNVRVTDPSGNAVIDVPESRFQVTEDGVPQTISLFMDKEIPLSYGLLIDSSGSLRAQYKSVIDTAGRIISSNKPADDTFLVRFISSDIMEVVQDTTSDKRALFDALGAFYIEAGQTAVIDGVYLGVDKLSKQKIDANNLRRRALVLVTDGEDRNSYYKKDDLFRLLASTDIQIFTIGFTKALKGKPRDRAIELLTQLANDTGGRTFFPSSNVELEIISRQIINDIRTQYVIGYVPSGNDTAKGFHKVLVSVTEDPNKEKRAAITRVGYGTQKK